MSRATSDRVLIGGVGYRNLRDHSAGVAAVDRLTSDAWPADVRVEDLSYNPVAVVQRLEDDLPQRPFDRVVLVSSVPRGGDRAGGVITAYRWDGELPPPEEIHRSICDAVTGIVSLDNLVIVGGHFRVWPQILVVVEVEPALHEFGESFSAPVAASFDTLCETVRRVALDPRECDRLPLAPLGGAAAPSHSSSRG